MLHSWTNKRIRFDYQHEVSCASYECDLTNYTPSKSGFLSKVVNLCGRVLRAPGTFFFDMLVRRHNPYPGTFVEQQMGSVALGLVKSKNWIIGSLGLLVSSPAYLAGTLMRAAAAPFAEGFTIVVNPTKTFSTQGLKVLTRNVALLPDSLNGRLNMRPTQERVIELANSFINPIKGKHQASVLLLQEVFDERASEELTKRLSTTYPYIIHKISPSAWGLPSGLMIASQHPILKAEFIQYPTQLYFNSQNSPGIRFNPDSVVNKGVLICLIKVEDELCVVVNSHCQQTTSDDPIEKSQFQAIRQQQLKIITQATFDFIADCEAKGKTPSKVIVGGDFNSSDKLPPGFVQNDRQRNAFFFKHIFPGEKIATWMKSFDPQRPDEHDLWDAAEKDKDSNAVIDEVYFDHIGLFFLKSSPCQIKTQAYFDQGYSQQQPTASSDHAGLLLKVKPT